MNIYAESLLQWDAATRTWSGLASNLWGEGQGVKYGTNFSVHSGGTVTQYKFSTFLYSKDGLWGYRFESDVNENHPYVNSFLDVAIKESKEGEVFLSESPETFGNELSVPERLHRFRVENDVIPPFLKGGKVRGLDVIRRSPRKDLHRVSTLGELRQVLGTLPDDLPLQFQATETRGKVNNGEGYVGVVTSGSAGFMIEVQILED